MDFLGNYDVVVVGAGHAGIEAAHAAAMLGAKTAIFTLTLDFIGNMPCNPSIGGTAKGHLVREIDALGGLMGIAADATFLQSRMLNRGKGPAVHSLRVQTDRKRYHMWMKHALELTPNLAGLAEPCEGVRAGQHAGVYIKSILPEKMKIKLVVVNKNLNQKMRFEPHYFVTRGRLDRWIYSTSQSRKQIETVF